ncbi:hypothetical protein ES703_19940 [subsurface metagenome]
MATRDISIWTKIRRSAGLIRDFVAVAGPEVWRLRGIAALQYSGGLVDAFYHPAKRHSKTEEQFLQKVACFGARVMDRMLPREGIDQVNIWAEGRRHDEGVWIGVRLILDKKGRLDAGVSSLSDLAAVDPQRYFELCSLEWVDESAMPEWPSTYQGYTQGGG